jgi:ATP-binding cassette subfamily B protein
MMAMGWVINLIQRGAASLDRINVILETKAEVADPRDPIAMTGVNGDIVFDRVGFRYGLALPHALTDVSFRLNAGETLGVVGPTGCGKTTLCHLIPRLFDVTEGSVLIDGMDVRRMSLQALRANVAVVPQTPFLFSGTIRENLCFGNEHASEAAMASACEAARLYDTIIALPDRFDTVIGEKGVTLSGGQRQRLALARALLVDTPILVLDDPLSQVDTETAAGILARVREFCRNRTTVIVSHRISHVRHAGMILVLENGKTSGLGTHEELMADQGFYSKMYLWQEIEEGFAQTNG